MSTGISNQERLGELTPDERADGEEDPDGTPREAEEE